MNQNNLISGYITNQKLDIEKVMSDFTPYLYTILKNRNVVLSNEDIEEIISDVFVAVWKNQERLDWSSEMKPYLVGITKNMMCKKMKKVKFDCDISEFENVLSQTENVEFEVENAEKESLILAELNQMKLEDREIFMLYYYFSRNGKEIALELNISEQKVKSRLFRIRRKLKKALEKRGYQNGTGI